MIPMSGEEVIPPNAVPSARKQGAAAWRLLIIVVLIQVLNVMDRQVIQGVLEPIRHEFQLSDSQLGFLSGLAIALVMALALVPAILFVLAGRRLQSPMSR